MSSIKHHFKHFYGNVTNSIAFYPSVISFFFILAAIIMLFLEKEGSFGFLREHFSFLFIDNVETARVILATLIGGIFSLTVFSFSMVMVLLNQASTNFSPRLLPGLISDKRNQIVLGIYIGSLVYNILILIAVLPTINNITGIGLSVFLGIVMGIFCLGFFVFFIHTISTSIQINTILKETFDKAKRNLEEAILEDTGEWIYDLPSTHDWNEILTTESGYLQNIDSKELLSFINQEKTDLIVALNKGLYVLNSMPLFYTSKSCEKDSINKVRSVFIIDKSLDIHTNFLLGIRYITEVGVKALSPAVNDPGTAISTLDYLAELFLLRLKIKDYKKFVAEDQNHYLIIPEVPFEILLHDTLSAYRTYGKHDFNLMHKLQSFLLYLKKEVSATSPYKKCIQNQLSVLVEEYESSIKNTGDLSILKQQLG